jgi:hypothetical protein
VQVLASVGPMEKIFGFRVTLGDLVVALAMALIAERLSRLLPKLWAWVADYFSKRSKRARRRQLVRLRVDVRKLQRISGDPQLQLLEATYIVGQIAYNLLSMLAFLIVSVTLTIGFEEMRIETALGIPNDAFGLFADTSLLPQDLTAVSVLAAIMLTANSAFIALNNVNRLRMIRYPTTALAVLSRRIDRLTERL